jgi:LacI family transcriptional regulator
MNKKIPTLIDVANKCNLSVATVSRALSGTGYVSEKSKERVLAEAKKLGYSINLNAMGLRKSASRTLGLIVEDITVLDFAIFADSVCRTASENGYKVIVCVANEDVDLEADSINLLISSRVDGIIAIPTVWNSELWKNAIEHKIKLQFVDRNLPELKNVPVIMSDHKNAGAQAANYFIEKKFKKVVYLLPNLIHSGQLLKDGIVDAYKKSPVTLNRDQIMVLSEHRTPDMHLILDDLAQKKVDAIFCGSYVIANSMLKELMKGESAPRRRFSNLVYTDRSWIGGASPEVTILDNDFEKLGRLSVMNLLRDLSDGKQSTSKSVASIQKFRPIFLRKDTF